MGMIYFVTILACLVICGSDAAARGVSVDVGETVKLNCSASSSTAIRWERRTTTDHTTVAISNRRPEFSFRFNVTYHLEGFSQLSISDVRPSDAGQYYCISSTSSDKMANVTLSVIGYQISSKVVFAGATATFSCDSFSRTGIMWDFHSITPPSSQFTIYNGQQVAPWFQSRFNVTFTADNISYLSITDVRFTDAGVFECCEKAKGKQRSRGSLTVLDGKPRCAINSNNEFNCCVCHAGETEANTNITCQVDLEDARSVTRVKELNKTCKLYTKSLVFGVNLSDLNLSCSLVVASQHNGFVYNYTWTSIADQDEHRSSGLISIYPLNKVILQHGDKLTCEAGGTSQEAHYQWVVNDKVKSGSVYTIDECDFISESLQLSNTSNSVKIISISVLCIVRHGYLHISKTVTINTVHSEEYAKNCDTGNDTSRVTSMIVVCVVAGLIALTIAIALAVKLLRKRIECQCVNEKVPANDSDSPTNDTVHYAEIREHDTTTNDDDAVAAAAEIHAPYYVNIPVPMATELLTDEIAIAKPYEELNPVSREQPRPPPIYNRLSRTHRTQPVN